MPLNENLKKLRERQGLTGKELAEKVGLKYATYMTYESPDPRKARWCSENTLIKIARALNVSIDELLGFTPIPKSDRDKYREFIRANGFQVDYESEHAIHISDTTDIIEPYEMSLDKFDKLTRLGMKLTKDITKNTAHEIIASLLKNT